MTETFEDRAAYALMEDELTAPTVEDLFLRTMLLLKSVQAPSLQGTLPDELARKAETYLTELMTDFTRQLNGDNQGENGSGMAHTEPTA